MKKNQYKPIGHQIFILVASVLLLISCQKSTMETPKKTVEQTKEQENTSETTPTTLSLTDQDDIDFFTRLGQLASVSELVWKGYKLEEMPMYFIYPNFAGNPIRAYVINPPGDAPEASLEGIKKITGSPFKEMYRYDGEMEAVKARIYNGIFNFYTPLADKNPYYVQLYKITEPGVEIDPVPIAIHELFHVHQINQFQHQVSMDVFNNLSEEEKDSLQIAPLSIENYVVSKRVLQNQLLQREISQRLPLETDPKILRSYLEIYVASRNDELKAQVESESSESIQTMSNRQENSEGSAYYVEFFTMQKTSETWDRKVFSRPDISKNFTSEEKEKAKNYFSFGIWYETGAAAIYMLDVLGVEDYQNKILKEFMSPYDVAKEFLQMSPEAEAAALEHAKTLFDMEMIETETDRIFSLF